MMIAGGWKCGIAWQKCLGMEWNGMGQVIALRTASQVLQ